MRPAALPIFVSGIILCETGGVVFDRRKTGALMQLSLNTVSFAALVAIAYGVAWFKAVPGKRSVLAAATAANVILLMVSVPGVAQADGAFTHHTIEWQGVKRSFALYVPPDEGDRPLPLVIALHGAGDSIEDFIEETHLPAAADAAGMMVAFPASVEQRRGKETFNARICCGVALRRQVDDIGFVGAVIADIAAHRALDRSRIYATGMSNGGMLTYQLGALHPDWFAAIAPVSAAIGGTTPGGGSYLIPVPKLPMPVMIMHGVRDRVVLYHGGASPILDLPYRWKTSVADAVSFWAAADHCREVRPAVKRVSDALSSTVYADCAQGSAVRLWTIEHGDHSWPGDIFPGTAGAHSAAAEILAFFAQYRRAPHGGLYFTPGARAAGR